MNDLKIDFIKDSLCYRAWSASVQRANLYKKSSGEAKRNFRKQTISFLQNKLLPKYKNPCSEKEHYKNIDSLIRFANRVGNMVLNKDGYKYGVSQKLLNLTLKYYWCLDFVKEPPHCPIDRNIINEIDKTNVPNLNWTQITSKTEYMKIIEAIKDEASNMSISEWELRNY
ncbi:MAG: hypothetical protein C4522_10340 [Desulfobacteraceae bacterium]|nr:MAG: hypothetical protein C4522_10340 [Desulfobacteraceae bacterium]